MDGIELALRDINEELKEMNQYLKLMAFPMILRDGLPKLSDIKLPTDLDTESK